MNFVEIFYDYGSYNPCSFHVMYFASNVLKHAVLKNDVSIVSNGNVLFTSCGCQVKMACQEFLKFIYSLAYSLFRYKQAQNWFNYYCEPLICQVQILSRRALLPFNKIFDRLFVLHIHLSSQLQ